MVFLVPLAFSQVQLTGCAVLESNQDYLLVNEVDVTTSYCFVFNHTENITFDCDGNGIYLETTAYAFFLNNSRNITLMNCEVHGEDDTGYGVGFFNTTQSEILDSDFGGLDYAIYMENSSENRLSSIRVSYSMLYSVYLKSSHNNTLEDLYLCTNNNEHIGLFLEDSNENRIFHSTFRRNPSQDLKLVNSHDNLIYDNRFLSPSGVYDDSQNFWNTTEDCSTQNIVGGPCIGGNYYVGNLGCDDSDGDGFCDSPYPIPGGSSQDALPLASPCHAFSSNEFYQLQADVYTSGSCFVFQDVENATLDCQGHFVEGIGEGSGAYLKGARNITILNCHFRNFDYGVYAENSSESTLYDLLVSENDVDGVYLLNCTEMELFDITSERNSRGGITLENSPQNHLKLLSLSYDGSHGLWLYDGSDGNLVEDVLVVRTLSGVALNSAHANVLRNISGEYCTDTLYFLSSSDNVAVNVSGSHNSHNTVLLHNAQNNTVVNVTSEYSNGAVVFYGTSTKSNMVINVSALGDDISSKGLVFTQGPSCNYVENATFRDMLWGVIFDSTNCHYGDLPGNNTLRKISVYDSISGVVSTCSKNDMFLDLFISETEGCHGVYVSWGSGIFINVSVEDIIGEGFYFYYSNGTLFNVSVVEARKNGLKVESCLGGSCFSNFSVVIFGARFEDNLQKGILVEESRVYVNDTSVRGNLQEGIYLEAADQSVLENSNVSENQGGVLLLDTYSAFLSNLRVGSNLGDGLRMDGSDNNVVRHSFFWNNSDYQIALFSSEENLLYDNWISISGLGLYDDSQNHWNTTKDCSIPNVIGGRCVGGNYYSNYLGKDQDGDGLGETPYPISSQSVDFLPLTNRRPSPSPPFLEHSLSVGVLADVEVNQGERFFQTLSLTNTGDFDETLEISVTSVLPYSSPSSVSLSPGETKEVSMAFTASSPGRFAISVALSNPHLSVVRSFWVEVVPSGASPPLPSPPPTGGASSGEAQGEEETPEVYSMEGPWEVLVGETVFYSLLRNGRPAANLSVNLTFPSGEVVSLRTDADGNIGFTPEEPGNYRWDLPGRTYWVRVLPRQGGGPIAPQPGPEQPGSSQLPSAEKGSEEPERTQEKPACPIFLILALGQFIALSKHGHVLLP